jgi:hypothetical protein
MEKGDGIILREQAPAKTARCRARAAFKLHDARP